MIGVRVRKALFVLASRRFAVLTMVTMAGVLSLSALVPDLDTLEPSRVDALLRTSPLLVWIGRHLRPRDIVGSPLFLLLPLYLCAGIGYSLLQRVRAERKRGRGPSPGADRFRAERRFQVAAPFDGRSLERQLRREGYEVISSGPDHVDAARGRRGFWGSIAFHVGLILILIGVIASIWTRFGGEVMLAEGFRIPFAVRSMFNVSGRSRFTSRVPSDIAIRDFTAEYSPAGTPSDYALILSVQRGGDVVKEQQVRVNQAFWWDGYQITLHRYGFAPALTASGPDGRIRLDGVAMLQLLPPGREDALRLEDGSRIVVRLFPDFATVRGEPSSRTLAPVRPVLLFRWLDERGREVAAGSVERGTRTTINRYTVAFPSLRYWGGFIVARDLGLWLFVAGSLLGSIGLALRIVFPDQLIRTSWQPSGGAVEVRIRAGTRFFPALHEEQLDRLLSRIKAEGR